MVVTILAWNVSGCFLKNIIFTPEVIEMMKRQRQREIKAAEREKEQKLKRPCERTKETRTGKEKFEAQRKRELKATAKSLGIKGYGRLT